MKLNLLNIASICIIITFFVSRSGCQHVPYKELDGKILKDDNGHQYKLEWVKGWGETWRFLEKKTNINATDTTTKWVYVNNN
jgi:hypothetical protein